MVSETPSAPLVCVVWFPLLLVTCCAACRRACLLIYGHTLSPIITLRLSFTVTEPAFRCANVSPAQRRSCTTHAPEVGLVEDSEPCASFRVTLFDVRAVALVVLFVFACLLMRSVLSSPRWSWKGLPSAEWDHKRPRIDCLRNLDLSVFPWLLACQQLRMRASVLWPLSSAWVVCCLLVA